MVTSTNGPETPVIYLPPQIGKNTPPVKVHTISHYDQDGPFWAWNWLELGEHTGTHFDAPVHWITGKDYADGTTDRIPPQVSARVCVEFASSFGWERYAGRHGQIIAMQSFGASAPLKELQTKFGFAPENIVAAAKAQVARTKH